MRKLTPEEEIDNTFFSFLHRRVYHRVSFAYSSYEDFMDHVSTGEVTIPVRDVFTLLGEFEATVNPQTPPVYEDLPF